MDHYGKPNISTIDFLGNYFYVYFIFPQIPSMESSKEKTYSMPTPFNVETSQVYNSMSGLLCLVCILKQKQKHKHAKHGWFTIPMIF